MYVVVSRSKQPVVALYMEIIEKACRAVGSCERLTYPASPPKKSIIITDDVLAAFRYRLRGFQKHAVWMQGILPEESYLRNRSKLRFAALSLMEWIFLKHAGLLFLVSDEMQRHYEKKYRISLADKCFIMPCFNETGVNEAAFETPGKYETNSFVYVGSLSEWQCFDKTVALYAEIEKSAEASTSFTVFTSEKEMAEKILREKGVKSYRVDYAEPEALGERLRGFKYGFVIRDDIAVNRVATPTKLSNYLSNGIIPIYSDCLRSFHALNERLKLGVACDIAAVGSSAQTVQAHMRLPIDGRVVLDKCREAFETYYCAEAYVGAIAKRLREIGWDA